MISILCPTRKRPAKLLRMIESVRLNSSRMPEIICYVDHDDHSYDDFGLSSIRFVHGPRSIMSDMWNILLPWVKGDLLMLCGDDCVFKTPGWDRMVEKAFEEVPDKILLVFGDDGCPNGRLFATHPIVHRKWTDIVGYFSGPGFSCDYADAWPNDLADMIGRKRFLPFEHEHLHPVWGKAEYDEVYQESNARLHRDNCSERYDKTRPERLRDAEKLRVAMIPGVSTEGWMPELENRKCCCGSTSVAKVSKDLNFCNACGREWKIT